MFDLIKTRKYWFILPVQVFLIFLAPFLSDNTALSILFVATNFGVFGLVTLSIWRGRIFLRALAVASAVVAIMGALAAHTPGLSLDVVKMILTLCCWSYALFIFIASISIGKDVLFMGRVTTDRLMGSICVYLFIGMFFAYMYAAISLTEPGAFKFFDEWRGTGIRWEAITDFVYFSFSTLTTTGFGDIIPTKPFTKMLAMLESIVGTLYIAIMISRLVGLHIADKGEAGRHSH